MTQSNKILREQKKMRQYKVMMKQVIGKRKTTTKPLTITTTITTTTTTPLTILPCLPDEIICNHILPKLPVRSILRFNCVSKLWYETIQDPDFLVSHLNHSKSKPSLFAVFHDRHKLRFLHLEGEGYHCNAKAYSSVDLQNDWAKFIIGNCNGLTCAIALDQIDIINPSTREVLAIPKPEVQVSLPLGGVYYGFGFDPFMNEYKLIHFRFFAPEGGECVIYTLGTHSWRNITAASHYPQSYRRFNVAPICSSGVLFWMTNKGSNILSFDVHHEIFKVIPCPHVPQGFIRHSLFELRGCPCLVYDKVVDGELRLYTLTDHHLPMHTKQQQQSSNWICEKFTVHLPYKPDTSSFIRVVTFSGDIFLQWISNDGLFILYNADKGRSQKKSSGLKSTAYHSPQDVLLVNHVENLMSLKTLVPPGATKVKYVSSLEAAHESPTTPCSEHQREKREKDRLRLLRNEGATEVKYVSSSEAAHEGHQPLVVSVNGRSGKRIA